MEDGERALAEKGDGRRKAAGAKLKSAKLWLAVWACAAITFIVASGKAEFLSTANLLCAVPLAYFGANVAQKKILSDGSEP